MKLSDADEMILQNFVSALTDMMELQAKYEEYILRSYEFHRPQCLMYLMLAQSYAKKQNIALPDLYCNKFLMALSDV